LAEINYITRLLKPGFIQAAVVLCFLNLPLLATEHDTHLEDTEIELESIRTQIKDVQSKIDDTQKDIDTYLAELKENELSIIRVSDNLETIDRRISTHQLKLSQLQEENREQLMVLAKERDLLADQIRTAYKTGRYDFLKLLLNQENPEHIGRIMTYHDFYNKARSNRITEIKVTLTNIERLQLAIDSEAMQLIELKGQQMSRLEQLASFRDKRARVLDQLNAYKSEQDQELQSLQVNEEALANLVNELKNRQNVVELYENLNPFDSLKGKLTWPVNGNIINRFGTLKSEGKLRWNGVTIAAAKGDNVAAVSAGEVVFADWFRNLGLLMIIDHGDGYMSLYGHNERLLKKSGDFVATGEIIGKVGNTGGQSANALYFEIRRQGNPLNPGLWCRR
jgi:septal ring factor EnvC (AmiA/AmiB activator)